MRTGRNRWLCSMVHNGERANKSPDKRKKVVTLKQAQERFTLLGYTLEGTMS